MTQPLEMHTGKPSALPWVLATLGMIAGAALFWIAGGISFNLAEIDSPGGPWASLAGGGALLAAAGFLVILFSASNVVVRRQRESILPTARLSQLVEPPSCFVGKPANGCRIQSSGVSFAFSASRPRAAIPITAL